MSLGKKIYESRRGSTSKQAFKMTVEFPESLINNLKRLTDTRGNVITRNALRAAVRPVRKHLKQEVRVLRGVSDQSTGATYRAVTQKVTFPSKTRAAYGYFYAGVDVNHEEKHMKNTAALSAAFIAERKGRGRSVLKDRLVGRLGIPRKASKVRRKQLVKSYQKTAPRIYKRRGNQHQINRPSKYWHLLEYGFTHYKSGTRFPGYGFAKKSEAATRSESIAKFEEVLANGLRRELERT